MKAPPFGLPPATVEKIHGVLRAHPEIDQAVIYGSRAKGNYKNGSDIDLTLHGEGLASAELMTISDELDDLLLPYSIDLSIFPMIDHADLRLHIERVGLEFYHRPDAGVPPLS